MRPKPHPHHGSSHGLTLKEAREEVQRVITWWIAWQAAREQDDEQPDDDLLTRVDRRGLSAGFGTAGEGEG